MHHTGFSVAITAEPPPFLVIFDITAQSSLEQLSCEKADTAARRRGGIGTWKLNEHLIRLGNQCGQAFQGSVKADRDN